MSVRAERVGVPRRGKPDDQDPLALCTDSDQCPPNLLLDALGLLKAEAVLGLHCLTLTFPFLG